MNAEYKIGLFNDMIKTIYICDKCGKQKTTKQFCLPEEWTQEYHKNRYYQYCSKKCMPKHKTNRVNPNKDNDPGIGALYGRT